MSNILVSALKETPQTLIIGNLCIEITETLVIVKSKSEESTTIPELDVPSCNIVQPTTPYSPQMNVNSVSPEKSARDEKSPDPRSFLPDVHYTMAPPANKNNPTLMPSHPRAIIPIMDIRGEVPDVSHISSLDSIVAQFDHDNLINSSDNYESIEE